MSDFRLQIVTPEGAFFDGQAQALRLRTSEGYLGILPGHMDMIAALEVGMVTVTREDRARTAACGGGFLSVEKGRVRLVATTFEYAEDIDVPRARLAKERAEARLEAAQEDKEIRLAKAKLSRALNRLAVAETL